MKHSKRASHLSVSQFAALTFDQTRQLIDAIGSGYVIVLSDIEGKRSTFKNGVRESQQ